MTFYLHSMGRTVRIWVMTCRCTWLKTGGAKIKIVTYKALETSASKITLKKEEAKNDVIVKKLEFKFQN